LDIELVGIVSNNGLLRDVKSTELGAVDLLELEFSVADYFNADKNIPVRLRLRGSYRSTDLAQPLQVWYSEPDRKELVEGLAIYQPVHYLDSNLDLFYPDEKGLVPLRTNWLSPGKKVKISGILFTNREERRDPYAHIRARGRQRT
jgi:hypothetical protein